MIHVLVLLEVSQSPNAIPVKKLYLILPENRISEESICVWNQFKNMFNSFTQKTGNLANTVWQNANISSVKAAVGTAGAVAGGVGSTILKQAAKMMDRNQKLKETFACYQLDDKGYINLGTIHFTRNELIFSSETALPLHINNTERDLPLLPAGEKNWEDCFNERRSFVWQLQFALKWEHIKEIKIGGDAENPFERYIEITTYQGYHYIFKGFLNYQKAFAHLYSLLESSSWS